MKVLFKNSQAGNSQEFGPYKHISLMYEWLVVDGEELAVFDVRGSGKWEIKQDNTKWDEISID